MAGIVHQSRVLYPSFCSPPSKSRNASDRVHRVARRATWRADSRGVGAYCVFTSPSCSTWICSFVCRALTLSGGNSTLQQPEVMVDVSMRLISPMISDWQNSVVTKQGRSLERGRDEEVGRKRVECHAGRAYVREALDQGEFMFDFSPMLLALFLGLM